MLAKHFTETRGSARKQRERTERIARLPESYLRALNDTDKEILDVPVSSVVSNVQAGKWTPTAILHAYARKALAAHAQTNCLTEVMLDDAEVWAGDVDIIKSRKAGPLAGMPVSLKDTVAVAGHDACLGYAAWVGRPVEKHSALVRLLLDAGAVPFVKTAIPTTLLSFESASAVFGRATNPHGVGYSPGGSSGGEAALLALGGSRIGIGTDVAGSVRLPSHYSGVYTIKASAGRFTKMGNASSMPGQEGVPAVYSPMARTLEDLETFWKAIFLMEPWSYDHSVLHMPWKDVNLLPKTRFGVMWDDGVVQLSPACRRALTVVVDNLRSSGYEVVDFNPPDPVEGLQIASQLLLADGGKTAFAPILWGEPNDPGMASAYFWFRLPSFVQRLYIWWVRYIRHDALYARLLDGFREKTVEEHYKLVARREGYRAQWFDKWGQEGLDLLLTAPNALPALDYSAGVLPITKVDGALDALSPSALKAHKAANTVARDAYDMYDALAMAGLPVGVQVVGQRLEEEKVMEGMKLIERALKERGSAYKLLSV
ncbi:amidase signature enzyme [Phellopilus nigrolimitatus]|nr:amidase signature enzyme [Phellopilus nigrolimitatus]